MQLTLQCLMNRQRWLLTLTLLMGVSVYLITKSQTDEKNGQQLLFIKSSISSSIRYNSSRANNTFISRTRQDVERTKKITVTSPKNFCREERKHVVYVRIPKTGSSTMTFIIWRFGLTKGLRFLLPRVNYDGAQSHLTADKFYLPKSGKYCDVMAVHVEYSYDNIAPYFPKDLSFVSLLREPMNQLYSTIYYIETIKNKIPGENKLDKYLSNPEIYEEKKGRSYTHNPMASYFGIRKEDFFNVEKIKEKINELEERFEMILILEKLDESLVLLKRKLCWKMSDILYKLKNRNEKKPKLVITRSHFETLKIWSTADYMIYEHFRNKLQIEITNGGKEYLEELTVYRKILNQTSSFCEVHSQGDTLQIEKTKFSSQFEITSSYCNFMNTNGLKVIGRIRQSQKQSGFCNINNIRRKKESSKEIFHWLKRT